MFDHEVLDSQLKSDRFPFRSEGEITLKVRNANYTLGPVMLHIGMKPGALIPTHFHKGMAEALCIVESEFTNEGKHYQTGTSLHFKAGKIHGRTPLRMDADYSLYGPNARRRSLLISATSP